MCFGSVLAAPFGLGVAAVGYLEPRCTSGPQPLCLGLLLFGFVLVAALKVGSADQHAYKKLVFGEGGLVEWSQVLFLASGIRLSWLLADDLRQRLKERWIPLLFRGLAAALSLLLLEELAWGQVIFGWRTPELMQEINAQNETTLHNIGWFQDRLDLGYFLVTLAVLAAVVLAPWLAARFRPRASAELAEVLRCITPATHIWPLFLAVAVLAFLWQPGPPPASF